MYRKWIVKLTKHARFSTLCLHAGQLPDPSTGAIITPIYQTSTYVQQELGKHKGYEYARTQNPTREALERNIAAIEGGVEGLAFASGMAAIGAIATMLKAGDHVGDAHVVRRNPDQPGDAAHGPGGRRRHRQPAPADACRRQHVCQSVRA